MKAFMKCEICSTVVSGERCVFAIYRRTIGGEEYYFCCEDHAKEFERKHRRQKSKTGTQKQQKKK